MPLDKSGKYHMNPQRAMAADNAAATAPGPIAAGGDAPQEDAGQVVATIYQKPDGSYCTEDAMGQRQEGFADMESAAASLAQPQEPMMSEGEAVETE